MEGKFQYYFANRRVRVQDCPEGSFIKSTLIGPAADVRDAIPKYFLAYPIGGYDTKVVYEGSIINHKGKEEKVVVFRRFSHCD